MRISTGYVNYKFLQISRKWFKIIGSLTWWTVHWDNIISPISEDMEIAQTFNESFVNTVPSLKISPKENYETDAGNDDELILNCITKNSEENLRGVC